MKPNDLIRKCDEAMRLGFDFATIWNSIIKSNSAVSGLPIQRHDGARTYLEVPLERGDWLVIDFEAKKVSRKLASRL